MADRNAAQDDHDVLLGDALRALRDELQQASSDGLQVEAAAVELDVALVAGADGRPVVRLAGGSGDGKRTRRARVTLTLRSPGAVTPPAAELSVEGAAGRDEDQAPPAGDRPPGLLDLLADTLRSVADTASRPPASTAPRGGLPPWAEGAPPPRTS